jgi:hypothetical protein
VEFGHKPHEAPLRQLRLAARYQTFAPIAEHRKRENHDAGTGFLNGAASIEVIKLVFALLKTGNGLERLGLDQLHPSAPAMSNEPSLLGER